MFVNTYVRTYVYWIEVDFERVRFLIAIVRTVPTQKGIAPRAKIPVIK